MKKFLGPLLFFLLTGAYAQQNTAQRVVSFSPVLTESIYLLGAEDKLVADTLYCTKPEAAKKKIKIGTITDMNIEKVLSLEPDLVLATTLTPQRVMSHLARFGIRVETFAEPKSFDELCEQFTKLGDFLGKGDLARQITNKAKKEVAQLKRSRVSSRVFVQIGSDPLFSAHKDSFINDLIEFAGAVNIAKEAKAGMYTREEVLRQNPDAIIIASMGMASEEQKKIWQNYKSLNAAKDGRIYVVDPDMVCSPTPPTFVKALKEFINLLNDGDE